MRIVSAGIYDPVNDDEIAQSYIIILTESPEYQKYYQSCPLSVKKLFPAVWHPPKIL